MKYRMSLAAVAALGLAACGGGTPATDGAATPAETASGAPAEPAAATPAAATPDTEGPAAGKWKITMSTSGMTLPASEACYTKQTSLAEAQKMQADAGVTCGEQSYKREGDTLVGHYVCSMDANGTPMKVTTDMRVTGDFSTKYTMDMTNTMDPPPAPGMAEQKMTIVAERVGDC